MKNYYIKYSQLPRNGYEYQDLICIKILVEWYHNPHKYQWVKIEGAEKDNGIKSLDDIIVLNQNDQYELYQVKFTSDSQRDDLKLSFDWLLKKTKHGKSLLQKWNDDVVRCASQRRLSSAKLVTNRVPDEELEACLKSNSSIDMDLIPNKYIEKIKLQFGGYAEAKFFFNNFAFAHSQKETDDLEGELYDSLVPDHTSKERWYEFLEIVSRWATRKNFPPPDGIIRFNHLTEILCITLPHAISQALNVPPGYVPPNEKFHREVLEQVLNVGIYVVYGVPGMGKSTYLSYLSEQLNKQNIPVIRHHYSLSIESVIDRVSYSRVACSLQAQLKTLYPITFNNRDYNPEELEEWILLACTEASKLDKKLVMIIDGLDHVTWIRSEKTQLEHLVNRLIPHKDKICLLYGTQDVSDIRLPALLISSLPREYWKKLSPMDLSAIKSLVVEQVNSKKFVLTCNEAHKQGELADIAKALLEASGGYPLYIIYSLKSLALSGKPLNKYQVELLPKCPEGDIRKYYERLWVKLSASARKILLLIACVEFPWPNKRSIGYCFEDSLQFEQAFNEIQHLVENKNSGIFPLHESVLVFLRSREEFNVELNELLYKVNTWLVQAAPIYWQWGWRWIVEAKLGNTKPIISGITRDWLISSFCKGYPLYHIEHIITVAENIAFENNLFAELLTFRHIKIRLINGPEYQLQEYSLFLKCALRSNPDNFGILWRIDNIRTLNDEELAVIASFYKDKDNPVNAACLEEAMQRLEFYAKFNDESQYRRISTLVGVVIDILTDVKDPDLGKITRFLRKLRDKNNYFKIILDKLISSGNSVSILEFPLHDIPKESKTIFWDYYVLALCAENISVLNLSTSRYIKRNSLGVIVHLLSGKNLSTSLLIKPILAKTYEDANSYYFYSHFFFQLAIQLEALSEVNAQKDMVVDSIETFICKATSAFHNAAYVIAKKIKNGDKINVFEIYNHIENTLLCSQATEYKLLIVEKFIQEAIMCISVDLYCLLLRYNKAEVFDLNLFESIECNKFWNLIGWLTYAARRILNYVPIYPVKAEIQKEVRALKLRRDNTATLANDSLILTTLACQFNVWDELHDCLILTANHTLGYGGRKDITLHNIYETISKCALHKMGNIPHWLQRISPFINCVFDYTEREVRHIPSWHIDLLAQFLPERIVEELDFHLTKQHWQIVDAILVAFVKYFNLDTPAEYALLRCLSVHEALACLKERAKNNLALNSIYNEQLEFLGGFPPSTEEKKYNTPLEKQEIEIQFELYTPSMIKKLDQQFEKKGVYLASEYYNSWIDYWTNKGYGLDILIEFDKLWNEQQDIPHRLRSVLHSIFSLSYKLQGRKKAYFWAIRDVKLNKHWSNWSDNSIQYLEKYASAYSSQWKIFLSDTLKDGAIKRRGEEWLVVPSYGLVSFLFAAGQHDLACSITEAMLTSLENEIRHLHLPPSYWYEKPISTTQISARLLCIYYKWPDRFIRLRIANEIAGLLKDHPNTFRSLYLDHLSKIHVEADVVNFLSILLLIKKPIFSSKELHASIQSPSILSNEVLYRLGCKVIDRASMHSTDLLKNLDLYEETSAFKKAKDGIPPILFNLINKLSEKINYPLNKYMAVEWSHITSRQNYNYFYPYDFCANYFYRSDKISHSLSTSIESTILSAYLRTLSFAKDKLGLSYDEAISYSMESIPFGAVCSKMLPSAKPIPSVPGTVRQNLGKMKSIWAVRKLVPWVQVLKTKMIQIQAN